MKAKTIVTLLVGGLLVVAAGLVHVPAQADPIPEQYRDTVAKGLEYLAKNQLADGHWESDGGQHPVAMTGLVGLALLMERPGLRGRESSSAQLKQSGATSRAAAWLLARSRRDGLILSGHESETSRYMEGHGLAMIFLAGVYKYESDVERRKKLEDVLGRAVKAIVKAQSTAGGWHHTSKVEGHDFDTISATVIQIQALDAVQNAGIAVPRETLADAQRYLATALAKVHDAATVAANFGPKRQAELAGALACRELGGRVLRDLDSIGEPAKTWFQVCRRRIPMGKDIQLGRDDLAHYYFAQAEHAMDEFVAKKSWPTYRAATFDHLRASQNKDGSWPAAEGLGVGPVYAAALWCTILQLDNESHPSHQRLLMEVTALRFERSPAFRFEWRGITDPEAA